MILFRLGYVSFPYPWEMFLSYPWVWELTFSCCPRICYKICTCGGMLRSFFIDVLLYYLSPFSTHCKTCRTLYSTHILGQYHIWDILLSRSQHLQRRQPHTTSARSQPNHYIQDGLSHLLPRLSYPHPRKKPDSCEQRRPTQRHQAL